MSKDIKILVATHKKYRMPKEGIYIPVHVGCEGKQSLGYQGDNTGDHISEKNPNFCELTGLYWAWKNLECDYIGLCHYRRYFTKKDFLTRLKKKNEKFDLILNKQDIVDFLSEYDVILPKKRNYFIETIWSHYKHAHYIKDLEETKTILEDLYPEYIESFNQVMQGRTLHLFNMFIMDKKLFDEYCQWVFNILFELEKRIDIAKYDSYQGRIFGFLSERLFNVWLTKNSHLKRIEIPAMNMETINWLEKGYKFVKRKVSSNA